MTITTLRYNAESRYSPAACGGEREYPAVGNVGCNDADVAGPALVCA
jgi:hypothetical protein